MSVSVYMLVYVSCQSAGISLKLHVSSSLNFLSILISECT